MASKVHYPFIAAKSPRFLAPAHFANVFSTLATTILLEWNQYYQESWLDASGRSPWDTDDEDIVDGSGSGRDSDMFNEEFTQTALHTVAPKSSYFIHLKYCFKLFFHIFQGVTLSPSSTSSTRPEIVNDIIKSSTLAYASFHLALSVHIQLQHQIVVLLNIICLVLCKVYF
uniref:Transmembrane protein n=1 Tax=Heterorhabditis bacteriophora TaxID=37862 RepID=A0A1I7X5R5_HETBA